MVDVVRAVATGTLTASGKAPVLEETSPIPVISLQLTGLQPARGVGLRLDSFAPTLIAEEGLIVSRRQLLLDTTTPTVFQPETKTPPVLGLSIAGLAPIRFIQNYESVPAESLTLAGGTVTLDAPDFRYAQPGKGVGFFQTEAPISLTGTAKIFGPGRKFGVLAGLAPDLARSDEFTEIPSTAVGTFSGIAVTLKYDYGRTPATYAAPLTGLTPFGSYGEFLGVPTGTMNFVMGLNFIGQPVPDLSITGTVSTLIQNNILDATVGGMALSGIAPEATVPGVREVPVRGLELSAFAPTLNISSFFGGGRRTIVSLTTERTVVSLKAPTIVG